MRNEHKSAAGVSEVLKLGLPPHARARRLDADGDLGQVELEGGVPRVPPSAARIPPVNGRVAKGGIGVVGPVRSVAEGAAPLHRLAHPCTADVLAEGRLE